MELDWCQAANFSATLAAAPGLSAMVLMEAMG
jgi:hypothetical protein